MARRPAGDERSVVPDLPRPRRGERVFLIELSNYLHFDLRKLHRWAQKRDLLRFTYGMPIGTKVFWVTPLTASRLIAFARAIQGAEELAGKDFHAIREKMLADKRRSRARIAARLEAERTRADLCIAFPEADPEDKSREGESV